MGCSLSQVRLGKVSNKILFNLLLEKCISGKIDFGERNSGKVHSGLGLSSKNPATPFLCTLKHNDNIIQLLSKLSYATFTIF